MKVIFPFLESVDEFRKTEDVASAHAIVRRFIGPKSKTPVNLSWPVAEEILNQVQENSIASNLFNTAYEQIMRLLVEDSFRRFKKRQRALSRV